MLYFVGKFRYDAFDTGRLDGKDRSISFRSRAFFDVHFIQDWRTMVGDDPPFHLVSKHNYNASCTRVLSYSLYGNNPKYYKHMHRNIRDARYRYPGWCVRVHVHELAPKSLTQTLIDDGAQVFLIHDPMVRPGSAAGMFWRFLPLTEPGLSVIVLDSDDLITKYKTDVVDPILRNKVGKCFGGLWTAPFPKTHVRGACIVKFPPCTVAFSERRLRHYPVRTPFGADEYFMATEANIDPSRVYTAFYDTFNRIAWHIARDPVPSMTFEYL